MNRGGVGQPLPPPFPSLRPRRPHSSGRPASLPASAGDASRGGGQRGGLRPWRRGAGRPGPGTSGATLGGSEAAAGRGCGALPAHGRRPPPGKRSPGGCSRCWRARRPAVSRTTTTTSGRTSWRWTLRRRRRSGRRSSGSRPRWSPAGARRCCPAPSGATKRPCRTWTAASRIGASSLGGRRGAGSARTGRRRSWRPTSLGCSPPSLRARPGTASPSRCPGASTLHRSARERGERAIGS